MALLNLGSIPLLTPVVVLVLAAFLLKELFWIWSSGFKALFRGLSKVLRSVRDHFTRF